LVKTKRPNRCDASSCRKVDSNFIAEQIKELNNQVDALCNFANTLHDMKTIEDRPISLLSLGLWQSTFAAQKVGQWLDIGGNTRSSPDAMKSALLQRLFSGKPPLEKSTTAQDVLSLV
jgi:hypothetical protein